MISFFEKIMTNLPDNAPKEKVESFSSSNTAIARVTYAPSRGGIFPHYQFFIPIYNTAPVIIDNKTHPLETGSIVSSNPGQYLRNSAETEDLNCLLLVLFIDKEFLQDISKTLFRSESLEFKNICFSFSPKVKNLVYTFIEESNALQPGCELYLQNLSFQIAISMLREGNHNLSGKALSMQVYSDNKSVKTAIEFLTEHYDKTISLEELAHEVNYSSYHFLRIFKSATGMSPSEYLLNVKIEKAKKLLKYTNHAITEICYLCGFSSTSYFTQAFKKKTGVSPSYYKKNI